MSTEVTIRRADADLLSDWVELRLMMWPDPLYNQKMHAREARSLLKADGYVCFLAYDADGRAAGFAEGSVRPRAEGCETSPVGYVEGLYVRTGRRRRGIGRKLIQTLEAHFRSLGLAEMGSDAFLGEKEGQQAYQALGFNEAYRMIHYAKKIG